MIRVLLISFCFFLCVSDNEGIIWSHADKLTWQNFKAKPQAEIDAVALTVSGISFSYSLTQKANKEYAYKTFVEANFYPEKSWVKVKDSTNYILSHEQLHFDITELYARKLRKRISEFRFTQNIRLELNTINDDINNELELIQDQYDVETNHSILPEMQNKWQNFIKNELLEVAQFSSINK